MDSQEIVRSGHTLDQWASFWAAHKWLLAGQIVHYTWNFSPLFRTLSPMHIALIHPYQLSLKFHSLFLVVSCSKTNYLVCCITVHAYSPSKDAVGDEVHCKLKPPCLHAGMLSLLALSRARLSLSAPSILLCALKRCCAARRHWGQLRKCLASPERHHSSQSRPSANS